MKKLPPIVEALKKYKTQFMVDDCFDLPTRTPYGNIALNYQAIVIRIECLNESVIQLYKGFYAHNDLVALRGGWSHMDESFKHKFQIEQVIYWMRKTTDELIGMTYILEQYRATGKFPESIAISSIGKLLDEKKFMKKWFDGHNSYLVKLNEIANAYKHTFMNAQVHAYTGAEEPVVYALSGFNNIKSNPTFHSVGLRAMIEAFDLFLRRIVVIFESDFKLKREQIPERNIKNTAK